MERTARILLAEDHGLIAAACKDVLEERGFAVRHVLTGGDAVAAIYDDRSSLSGLITDIRLGSAPDGWEVARHARKVDPTIAVVYISGDSAHEHGARGVPNSLMLRKPFAMAQLITAISTLMNATAPHSREQETTA